MSRSHGPSADRGDGLQMYYVAVNIVSKETIADSSQRSRSLTQDLGLDWWLALLSMVMNISFA
jgi:hypothetical protein